MRNLSAVFLTIVLHFSVLAAEASSQYTHNNNNFSGDLYYLHRDALSKFPKPCFNCRALVLGAGAANEAIHLIKHGWYVTLADKDFSIGEIINNRAKFFYGKNYNKYFDFQNREPAKVLPKGKYDYVFSFFTIPFGDKASVLKRLRTMGPSVKPKGLIAMNFFGENCTYVKEGSAFAMTEKEVVQLFRGSGYEIAYLTRRQFNDDKITDKAIFLDLFEVIAIKK